MNRLLLGGMLGLVSCAGPPDNSFQVPGCLDLIIREGQNVAYLVDELRIVPARQFIVRLDSAQVSTRSLSGNRVGIPASLEYAGVATAATWLTPSPDSLVLVWWGGNDGVDLKMVTVSGGLEGQGSQRDDSGCPGSEYCYASPVEAVPVECPIEAWLQADSSGWVPWR